MAFMLADRARYRLMFHRAIPGFTPSPKASASSLDTLDSAQAWFHRNGYHAPGTLDLFMSLIVGLAGQQIANEPGGDRWAGLTATPAG